MNRRGNANGRGQGNCRGGGRRNNRCDGSAAGRNQKLGSAGYGVGRGLGRQDGRCRVEASAGIFKVDTEIKQA